MDWMRSRPDSAASGLRRPRPSRPLYERIHYGPATRSISRFSTQRRRPRPGAPAPVWPRPHGQHNSWKCRTGPKIYKGAGWRYGVSGACHPASCRDAPARAPRPRWFAGSLRSAATARRPCSDAHTAELPTRSLQFCFAIRARPEISASRSDGCRPRAAHPIGALAAGGQYLGTLEVAWGHRCCRGPTKPRAGCRPRFRSMIATDDRCGTNGYKPL